MFCVVGGWFPPGPAIPVDGGYRVSGQWAFGSGCHHAQWLTSMGMITDNGKPRLGPDGQPVLVMIFFPATAAEIVDTWHTLGMRRTGSHDIKLADVFIPERRTFVMGPFDNPGSAYRGPLYAFRLWLAGPPIASVALGIARAAVDDLIALAGRKPPSYTQVALSDRAKIQDRVARAKAMVEASLRMALEKSILSGRMATTRAYKKFATVFFSDIANFTTRCEQYAPRDVVAQVNTLFEMMTRIIMEHEGDIDKFIGDACMAFWLNDDPHVSAERAIHAALRMRREIARMNSANPLLVQDPIHIRMGLNTGEVILCDIGAAEARVDLTLIGDTVNTAARFESAAKQYGVDNLFSELTIQPLLDRFSARLIDHVRVKGKTKPVACYELFNEQRSTTPHEAQLIADFTRGVGAYHQGDFAHALTVFQATERLEKVTAAGALNPSRLYQERCQYLLAHPPTAWDGVWELTSK